jgi:hypothetical protein
MAPTLEATVPVLEEKNALENKPIVLTGDGTAGSDSQPTSDSVQRKHVPKFELEDHPIDEVQKLRVSLLSQCSPDSSSAMLM